MPYRIDETDGEYCVVKISDGQVMGCHETRREARAQWVAVTLAERDEDEDA